MITNTTQMIAYIWYIIRDYHVNTYPLKTVCNVAEEQLKKDGYNVINAGKGTLVVNDIPYRIFKVKEWNCYDVRQMSI